MVGQKFQNCEPRSVFLFYALLISGILSRDRKLTQGPLPGYLLSSKQHPLNKNITACPADDNHTKADAWPNSPFFLSGISLSYFYEMRLGYSRLLWLP